VMSRANILIRLCRAVAGRPLPFAPMKDQPKSFVD